MPFPSVVHEAFRHAFLGMLHRSGLGEPIAGQDPAGESLHLRGPLPWHPAHGHLFPIPLDASPGPEGIRRHRLLSVPAAEASQTPDAFNPPCLPAPEASPVQKSALAGWWTAGQLAQYLAGVSRFDPRPVSPGDLWIEEPRIPAESPAAGRDGFFPSACLRLNQGARIAIQAGLVKPAAEVKAAFDALVRQGQMLLGDDGRLVRFERKGATWPAFEKHESASGLAPFHVRWVLLTPAVFSHGSLPGWCRPSAAETPLPEGFVCLRERKNSPFLRARLIAHHLGSPLVVSGREGVDAGPGGARLAVPAGSVYHFLCADAASAERLVNLLHDRTRSDFFSEAGCGHGLCARPEPAEADLRAIASRLFFT